VKYGSLDAKSVIPVLQDIQRRPIGSDFELRQTLEAIAAAVKLDEAAGRLYVDAVSTIQSDFEKRQALTALVGSGLTPSVAAEAVKKTADISSDFEKRTALVSLIDSRALSTDGRMGVLSNASRMSSDFERRNVLTAFVQAYGVDAVSSGLFFSAVNGMTSDHERAEALLLVASSAREAAVRQGLVDAAERLSSTYEQNRVLAEVVHAERR
jgi:hypothetical protein